MTARKRIIKDPLCRNCKGTGFVISQFDGSCYCFCEAGDQRRRSELEAKITARTKKTPVKKKDVRPLDPVDYFRCQCEITTTLGAFVLGGPPRKRECCANVPTMVATESKPGEDGQCGEMSLCDGCFDVAQKQLTGVVYTRIEKKMTKPTKPQRTGKGRSVKRLTIS